MKELKKMSEEELQHELGKIRVRRKSWDGVKKKRKMAIPRLNISDEEALKILAKLEGDLGGKI